MSWFTDIAGKAEDFLNKIDQNAATVLTQATANNIIISPRKSSRSTNGTATVVNSVTQDEPETSSTLSGNELSNKPTSLNKSSEINGSSNYTHTIEDPDKIVTAQIPSSSKVIKPQTTSKSKSKSRKSIQVTSNSKSSSISISPTEETPQVSTDISVVSTPAIPSKDDDDLIAFLNDSNRKDLDENIVLKNELANQAREIELLFKNNKKLHSDIEILQQKILSYEEEKANTIPGAGFEAQLEQAEKANKNCKVLLKKKDEEIEKLKRSLDQTIEKLQQVEVLQETQNKLEVIEMEKTKLVQTNEELNQQISSLSNKLSSSESYISSMKNSLAIVETEFTNYKEKAKSILKQKDDLIASLQDDGGSSNSGAKDVENPFMPEINALRSERELLSAEISQSRATADSMREENHRLETELNLIKAAVSQLQRQVASEKDISSSFQEENLQYRQQVSVLQFELEKEKSERRKVEEQKLRSDAEDNNGQSHSSRGSPFPTGEQNRGVSSNYLENDDNLRTRITALSQALLEKQSLINNLSSDKQLLQINVERLQEQMRQMGNEVSSNSFGFSQTVISNQPLYLSESPWDSGMSMRMKRAFSTVDSLCCQAGLALRRRPNLRLGFCVYIIMLHFWVFFILFHSFSHVPHPSHPLNGPAPAPM